jgi:hypothetical protein
MVCLYCQAHLKGFVDSRVVVIHGYRDVACADLESCARNIAEQERAARNGGEPARNAEVPKMHGV